MHKINCISPSHWPSPLTSDRSKCHFRGPWALQFSEQRMLRSLSKHIIAFCLAMGQTRQLQTLSQPSHTIARKQSRRQSTGWTDVWRRTGSFWKRNWTRPSPTRIAESICIRDHSWSNFDMTSWIMETLAWKPLSSPTTTSATIWSTREPWPSTHLWKCCSGPSQGN